MWRITIDIAERHYYMNKTDVKRDPQQINRADLIIRDFSNVYKKSENSLPLTS